MYFNFNYLKEMYYKYECIIHRVLLAAIISLIVIWALIFFVAFF